MYVYVFRMVKDKETRVKEGMKIMGMKDSAYFWSYLFQFLIINFIVAVLGAIIMSSALSNISAGIRFLFLFLYGLSIYALAYFIQALVDKSTISIIMSILVYYIFYFVSPAVQDESISRSAKLSASLLSPTALQLGFISMSKFELARMEMGKNITYQVGNYSVADMLIFFIIDTLLYFFLGFYFENVLPHQFGVRRPIWFLFTPSYWCSSKKIKHYSPRSSTSFKEEPALNPLNFQDESSYVNKTKEEDGTGSEIDIQK